MATSVTSRMKVINGNITQLSVDAIVNAANEAMLGGGGVDGAIHRAAGPELFEECRTVGGCPTGEARITAGYQLPAKHIIHTVGPFWHGDTHGEEKLLASCYTSSLRLAAERKLKSIAFPCISTGVYSYPADLACATAIAAVAEWLRANEWPSEVIFCCFGSRDLGLYEAGLAKLERLSVTK